MMESRAIFYEDLREGDASKAKRKSDKLEQEFTLSKKGVHPTDLINLHLGPILAKRFKGTERTCAT